jgi:hypothetical protein
MRFAAGQASVVLERPTVPAAGDGPVEPENEDRDLKQRDENAGLLLQSDEAAGVGVGVEGAEVFGGFADADRVDRDAVFLGQ